MKLINDHLLKSYTTFQIKWSKEIGKGIISRVIFVKKDEVKNMLKEQGAFIGENRANFAEMS